MMVWPGSFISRLPWPLCSFDFAPSWSWISCMGKKRPCRFSMGDTSHGAIFATLPWSCYGFVLLLDLGFAVSGG